MKSNSGRFYRYGDIEGVPVARTRLLSVETRWWRQIGGRWAQFLSNGQGTPNRENNCSDAVLKTGAG